MPNRFSSGCQCCPSCALVITSADVQAGTNGNHTQQLTAYGPPIAGTFRLGFKGFTTDPLPWNATAAQVQAALEQLATINPGNVQCAGGPLPGTPITISLVGALGGQAEPLITVQPQILCKCIQPNNLAVVVLDNCGPLIPTYGNGTPGDDQSSPEPGVPVTVTGTDINGNNVGPLNCVTDNEGSCIFKDLPNGTYTVTITVPQGQVTDSNTQTVTISCNSPQVTFRVAPDQILLVLTAEFCAGFFGPIGSGENNGGCWPAPACPVTVTLQGGGFNGQATIDGVTFTPGIFPFIYGTTILVPRVIGGYQMTATYTAPNCIPVVQQFWLWDGFPSGVLKNPANPGPITWSSRDCVAWAGAPNLVPVFPCSWFAPGAGPPVPMPANYKVTVNQDVTLGNLGCGCVPGTVLTAPQNNELGGFINNPCFCGYQGQAGNTFVSVIFFLNCDGTYLVLITVACAFGGSAQVTGAGASAIPPSGVANQNGTCTFGGIGELAANVSVNYEPA